MTRHGPAVCPPPTHTHTLLTMCPPASLLPCHRCSYNGKKMYDFILVEDGGSGDSGDLGDSVVGEELGAADSAVESG